MTAPDARCGVVTRLDHGTSHGVLRTATATLAATDAYALPLGNPVVGGASWTSPARAAQRALGEAVERLAGHLVDPARLRFATAAALGASALDVTTLALYRPAQRARPGFPFSGLDPSAARHWTLAHDDQGTAFWVPASLIWLAPGPHAHDHREPPSHVPTGHSRTDSPGSPDRANHVDVWSAPGPHTQGHIPGESSNPLRIGQNGTDRRLSSDQTNRAEPPAGAPETLGEGRAPHLPVGAGLAAGETFAAARAGALAEVVERHALATAWYAGARFPELPEQPVPRPAGVRLVWHAVPNLLGAPVVACAAYAGDAVVLGCALAPEAPDPVRVAGRKAAAEALASLDALAAVRAGVPEWDAVLHPVRADRRYADSYRPDLSDATDLVCTLQLLADPRVAAAVATRLASGVPRGSWRPGPIALDPALRARGRTALTVDLSPPGPPGPRVARVLVPGLRSVAPAAFPFLGDGAEPLPATTETLPLPHV
ncbi:YcaO-like family protein [Actinocorallia sp. API 0066]|uniref:YcaO-like family protein n=1 Tax=Actinocorallia sp. API 0066 TaxID=2896846 RepID=UPI001E3FBE51|nr:YcaO-like family protein [Actinocorallia sp. API 0066]MCD0453502.1 YcaO-like family protein [Actinocorallia sp. API 0066]